MHRLAATPRILIGLLLIAALVGFAPATDAAKKSDPPEPTSTAAVDGSTTVTDDAGQTDAASTEPVDENAGGDDPAPTEPAAEDPGANQTDPAAGEAETPADEPAGDIVPGATPVVEPEVTDQADAAEEQPIEVAGVPAAQVDVTISAYYCDDYPVDLSECTAASGIHFDVSEDGGPPTTVETAAGAVTFQATEGSSLSIAEQLSDVDPNYKPVGNGEATIDSVAAGASLVFVHVLDVVSGRVQIVNLACPTLSEAWTEFRVIAPDTLSPAALEACSLTEDAVFSLTTGEGDPILARTGSDGGWRGFLPEGDYTATDPYGATVDFPVAADSITVIVAIRHVTQDSGELSIVKFACGDGDVEGTTIDVESPASGDPPAAGEACGPSDGTFTLQLEGSDEVDQFDLGGDGAITIPLGLGSYLLTDVASGEQATVAIADGVLSRAIVRQVVLTGAVIAYQYFCSDPASNGWDPTNPLPWESCTPIGSPDLLTLWDSVGQEVPGASVDGLIVSWPLVAAGTYGFGAGNGLCATFSNDADARSGFAVQAAQTTTVLTFACAPPVPDGGDGTGGDTDGTDTTLVTSLPNTGSGPRSERLPEWIAWLAIIALLIASGGISAHPLRTRLSRRTVADLRNRRRS